MELSILIATYNRAETLRETLEVMAQLDCTGLCPQFVIIDNNSSDHTRQIVARFSERLPVRYLFEPRPGKNRALNRALDDVPLGEIVVFTDDDVSPRRDWLQAIAAACRRWPDEKVFGGRIDVIWPDEEPPEWARSSWIHHFAFGAHDYGQEECFYRAGDYPFGGNFWVRREVFAGGRRYDETIGPHPDPKTMGSETSFLRGLVADGYRIVYCPDAVVGHRVHKDMLAPGAVRRRAYRLGRGGPHRHGLSRADLLERQPALWYLLRSASLARSIGRYLAGVMTRSERRRLERSVVALEGIAYNIESMRLGWKVRSRQTRSDRRTARQHGSRDTAWRA